MNQEAPDKDALPIELQHELRAMEKIMTAIAPLSHGALDRVASWLTSYASSCGPRT